LSNLPRNRKKWLNSDSAGIRLGSGEADGLIILQGKTLAGGGRNVDRLLGNGSASQADVTVSVLFGEQPPNEPYIRDIQAVDTAGYIASVPLGIVSHGRTGRSRYGGIRYVQ
jgi:hypothetical protein